MVRSARIFRGSMRTPPKKWINKKKGGGGGTSKKKAATVISRLVKYPKKDYESSFVSNSWMEVGDLHICFKFLDGSWRPTHLFQILGWKLETYTNMVQQNFSISVIFVTPISGFRGIYLFIFLSEVSFPLNMRTVTIIQNFYIRLKGLFPKLRINCILY